MDDEPGILQLFGRMLASAPHRYRVLRANNARRALSLLREHRPDVMLLDLIMPGMDGLQLLQQKAQDPVIQAIPVIAISSRDPTQGAVASHGLTVTRDGGLSESALLSCIRAVSEILSAST